MTSHDPRLRAPARVLLAVNDTVVADTVARALSHGYSTRVTATVEEAGSGLADGRPHLVVLDVESPAASVLDRLGDPTRLRQRPPVIALTRRADLEAKLNAFDKGV